MIPKYPFSLFLINFYKILKCEQTTKDNSVIIINLNNKVFIY